MKTWMSQPGPSVGTYVLGSRRVSLSADVSQETPGGCYSRDANEHGEVGVCHAHGEPIGAGDIAGDRSDDSKGCLFDSKADARMAEVPPRQRVAVDAPVILEAAGACDPRPAGTTSKPPVREADGAHSSDGCLLYTSPSPRDLSTSRMPSSA